MSWSYYHTQMTDRCPGYYCGRIFAPLNNPSVYPSDSVPPSMNVSAHSIDASDTPDLSLVSPSMFGECGPCPWGYSVSQNSNWSICQACHDKPQLYHWLYMTFMAFVPWLLHGFFIEWNGVKKKLKSVVVVVQHLSATLECLLATILSILVMSPSGQMTFDTCGVENLRDWYTMFFNPSLNYSAVLYCTQEAVYPLFTLPIVLHCFAVLFMLIIRPIPLCLLKCRQRDVQNPVLAALYFFPILTLIHSVFSGVIYYTFPYFLILIGLITNAFYLSVRHRHEQDLSFAGILHSLVTSPRHIVVIALHVLAFVFALVAITRLEQPVKDGCMLLCSLIPTLFYVATICVSDPRRLTRFGHFTE